MRKCVIALVLSLGVSVSASFPAQASWGAPGDVPVFGDYDGDGRSDMAVYRPSTGMWYVLTSSSEFTSYLAVSWGQLGDVPVPGTYDGTGKTEIAVWRPSTGAWMIYPSSLIFY